MQESGVYSYFRLRIGSFSSKVIKIDETILTSLEDHLTEIFEIRDKEDKQIAKTNAEIKQIVKNANIKWDIRQFVSVPKN